MRPNIHLSLSVREREADERTGGAQFNVVQHDLSGPAPPPPRSVTYPLRTEGFVGVILLAYRIRMRKTTERERERFIGRRRRQIQRLLPSRFRSSSMKNIEDWGNDDRRTEGALPTKNQAESGTLDEAKLMAYI